LEAGSGEAYNPWPTIFHQAKPLVDVIHFNGRNEKWKFAGLYYLK
jgi:hypothetical protein